MANAPMFDDYSIESASIDRRRQLAQALMQSQAPQGRMVGRVYVGANPLEYLAAGLKQYGGRKDLEQADADQRALGQRATAQGAEDIQGWARALQGAPAQPAVDGDDGAFVPEQAAVPGDPRKAMALALASRNPALQQAGIAQMKELTAGPVVVGRSLLKPATGEVVGVDSTWKAEQEAARAQKQAEALAAREAKAAELETRLADARTSREERAELQRQLQRMQQEARQEAIRLAASLRPESSAGKPPPGYRATADGKGLEAIPGGPADQKLAGQLNADTMALQGSTSSFDRLSIAANELLKHGGLKGITGVASKLPNMSGGAAADARAKLDTLKSQIAFGVLQDMRNQSKTGGALGAVSEKELLLLQNNLQALDQAQSYEAFQKSLKGVLDYAEQAKDRMRQAYNLKHGDKTPQQSGSTGNDPLGLRGKK